MRWSPDVRAALRRLLAICAEQAPVLFPTAFILFICAAILAGPLAALASALTLVAVVLGLAWTSSPG